MVRPDAGVAVGLQLHHHLQLVLLDLIGARPRLAHLLRDAGDGLDVVADLMRDDVGLREVARRLELRLELVPEGQVDVDLLVAGAVERAGARVGAAAGGDHLAAEKFEDRRFVLRAARLEDLRPGLFGVAEHRACRIARGIGGRAHHAGRRRGRRRAAAARAGDGRAALHHAERDARVDAEQPGGDERQHDAAEAELQSAATAAAQAAQTTEAATAGPLATGILHVAAAAHTVETHVQAPWVSCGVVVCGTGLTSRSQSWIARATPRVASSCT